VRVNFSDTNNTSWVRDYLGELPADEEWDGD
jgi:hypothetical protein